MNIEITIPCYNEERGLVKNIEKIHSYCQNNLTNPWQIIIADNGSTDNTYIIAKELEKKLPHIKIIHFDQKGRGQTLKKVWQNSRADILVYMDADLATNIKDLKVLTDEINKGNDLVIGSRYLSNSQTGRKISRKMISKFFIFIANYLLKTKITDFQCGFKAINQKFNQQIIPQTQNVDWWFDTEIIFLGLKHN